MPLHEQGRAGGVLLLSDAEHFQFPCLNEFAGLGVPPGHVLAAARSPRGEDVEHELVSTEVRDLRGCFAVDGRQRQ